MCTHTRNETTKRKRFPLDKLSAENSHTTAKQMFIWTLRALILLVFGQLVCAFHYCLFSLLFVFLLRAFQFSLTKQTFTCRRNVHMSTQAKEISIKQVLLLRLAYLSLLFSSNFWLILSVCLQPSNISFVELNSDSLCSRICMLFFSCCFLAIFYLSKFLFEINFSSWKLFSWLVFLNVFSTLR